MATERQCKRNFQDFEDDNVDLGHGQAPDRTVTDVPLSPFAASPPPKHLGGGLECFEEEARGLRRGYEVAVLVERGVIGA